MARMGRCADENGRMKMAGQGLLLARNRKLPGLDQPRGCAHIEAVTSHLGVEVLDRQIYCPPNFPTIQYISRMHAAVCCGSIAVSFVYHAIYNPGSMHRFYIYMYT